MNNKIIVIGIIFVLLFTVNFSLNNSHASLNMLYQAPIILVNNQNVSTPNPFQQMIKLNESNYKGYMIYNGSFANFEFVYGNGTVIPAWIESNNSGILTVWLKIYSIPASSSITIYIDFASLTTNLLSSSGTTGIGEAPQLSPTYAEYDDGASVFNFYDNFKGSTLSSKWVSGASGGTATINNGLSLLTPATVGDYVYVASATAIATQPIIVETYMDGNSIDVSGYRLGFGLVPSQTYLLADSVSQDHVSWQGTEYSTTEIVMATQIGTSYTNPGDVNPVDSNYHIWGIEWLSGEVGWWYNGYSPITTTTSNIPTNINYLTLSYYAWENLSGTPTSLQFQWVRTRAYPPNGVMPSVSFGTLSPIFKVSKSEEINIHAKIYALNLSLPEEWGVYGFLNYTIYGNNYSIPVSNLTNNYYLNLSINYNFSVMNNTTLQYNLSLYAYKLQDYIAINHLNYRGRLNITTTQKEYNITLNDSIIKFENVNNFYYFWDNYGYKVIGTIIIIGLFLFFISRLRRMR